MHFWCAAPTSASKIKFLNGISWFVEYRTEKRQKCRLKLRRGVVWHEEANESSVESAKADETRRKPAKPSLLAVPIIETQVDSTSWLPAEKALGALGQEVRGRVHAGGRVLHRLGDVSSPLVHKLVRLLQL